MENQQQEIFCTFSPSGETFAIGLLNGFSIYKTNPFSKIITAQFENQSIVTSVSSTDDCSVVVYSGIPKETSFAVFDPKIKRTVLSFELSDTVVRSLVLRNFFLVSSKNEIRLYTFNPPVLYSQFRTIINDLAPFDCIEKNSSFLLVLSGHKIGYLRIVNGSPAVTSQDFSVEAHSHPISEIKLSKGGDFVATASNHGTFVRLFRTDDGCSICQFKRGTFSASIKVLAFGVNKIGLISGNSTIHIYPVPDKPTANPICSIIRGKVEGNSTLVFSDEDYLVVCENHRILTTFICKKELLQVSQIDIT